MVRREKEWSVTTAIGYLLCYWILYINYLTEFSPKLREVVHSHPQLINKEPRLKKVKQLAQGLRAGERWSRISNPVLKPMASNPNF